MTTPEATIEAVPAGSQPIGMGSQCHQACAWKFDFEAIREAAATLELRWPILLEKSDGWRRVGCHRTKLRRVRGSDSDRHHGITVSRTLWHELTHAAQAEQGRLPRKRERTPWQQQEIEAECERGEEWHEVLPLTIDRTPQPAAAQPGPTPEREAEIEAAGERMRQRARALAAQELAPA